MVCGCVYSVIASVRRAGTRLTCAPVVLRDYSSREGPVAATARKHNTRTKVAGKL